MIRASCGLGVATIASSTRSTYEPCTSWRLGAVVVGRATSISEGRRGPSRGGLGCSLSGYDRGFSERHSPEARIAAARGPVMTSSQGPAPPVDPVGLSQEVIDEITRRWQLSESRWEALTKTLEIDRTGEKWPWAAVYVTGSLARYEAYELSDLDLFIIHFLPTDADPEYSEPTLVDTATLVAVLDAARSLNEFEPFSDGGHYLTPHSFQQMCVGVGGPQDDATNRFTARMLLLLNSLPLINPDAYARAREEILRLYWRDHQDPGTPYLPIFLLNDLRRHWLTMCLNFEQKNPPTQVEKYGSVSGGRRRIGNLKLRAARLLGCYTPILALLAESTDEGITRHAAEQVFLMKPLERLRRIHFKCSGEASELSGSIIELYGQYLILMRETEDELDKKLSGSDNYWKEVKTQTTQIGDRVSELLQILGEENFLYRFIVI